MIKVENFSKSYSSKKEFAVERLSLLLEQGKITGLLGPNGSGKTTLIKAICGFHYATEGTVLLETADKTQIDIAENPELVMQLVGYVPENPMLPPEMTVHSFLNYAALTHKIQSAEVENAISIVVKECSLEKFLEKKIKTLSKGQKQRVSFAQAIIHNPPNLILDEPISGLDPAQIIQMRDLIKKLSKTKAILMSTHILQEVYSLCDNLYIISEGKITASGTENQIIEQTKSKNLEEAFIKLTSTSDE